MLKLLLYRLAYMALTLLLVSVVTFVIIQLPPGDYADSYVAKKAQAGVSMTRQDVEDLSTRSASIGRCMSNICAGCPASCCMAISAGPGSGAVRSPR